MMAKRERINNNLQKCYRKLNMGNMNPNKNWRWTKVHRKVSSFCDTTITRRVILVTDPVIRYKLGKHRLTMLVTVKLSKWWFQHIHYIQLRNNILYYSISCKFPVFSLVKEHVPNQSITWQRVIISRSPSRFKTFMSESIARFKRSDNQSRNLNWKIISVKEWKCSGNSWPFVWWLCFGKCIEWLVFFTATSISLPSAIILHLTSLSV